MDQVVAVAAVMLVVVATQLAAAAAAAGLMLHVFSKRVTLARLKPLLCLLGVLGALLRWRARQEQRQPSGPNFLHSVEAVVR